MTTFIDIEPTWEYLCKMVTDPKELRPACVIADHVRQAQKSGAKSITFTFGKDAIDIETDAQAETIARLKEFVHKVAAYDTSTQVKNQTLRNDARALLAELEEQK
jgi:hypothetical protein